MITSQQCLTCARRFNVDSSKIKAGKGKYCSIPCARKSYKGPKNGRWNGGKVKGPDGRMMIYAPGHPMATACGGIYVLEYRLIMANKLGRMLHANEIVHHINGNKHDNRTENLTILNRSQHSREHGFERDMDHVRAGRKRRQ